MEHLDRDLPAVLGFLRQVDRRHAAATQLAIERVSIAEHRTGCHVLVTHGLRRAGTGHTAEYRPKKADEEAGFLRFLAGPILLGATWVHIAGAPGTAGRSAATR